MDLLVVFLVNLLVSVKYFGVKGNIRIVNDGVMILGFIVFLLVLVVFIVVDVGKCIDIVMMNVSGVVMLVVFIMIVVFVSVM